MRRIAVNSNRLVLAVLALACAGTIGSCKEGDPLQSDITPVTPNFEPEPLPAGVTSGYVSIREASVTETRVVLEIVLTEIDEPVTGVALDMTYPVEFSRFTGCSDGELFPTGKCHASEPTPGSLILGRAITSPGEARTVSGSRVAIELEFLVFGKGSAAIVFEGPNIGGLSAVLDTNGDPIPLEYAPGKPAWFSGKLEGL
jgi:hypothetical protein